MHDQVVRPIDACQQGIPRVAQLREIGGLAVAHRLPQLGLPGQHESVARRCREAPVLEVGPGHRPAGTPCVQVEARESPPARGQREQPVRRTRQEHAGIEPQPAMPADQRDTQPVRLPIGSPSIEGSRQRQPVERRQRRVAVQQSDRVAGRVASPVRDAGRDDRGKGGVMPVAPDEAGDRASGRLDERSAGPGLAPAGASRPQAVEAASDRAHQLQECGADLEFHGPACWASARRRDMASIGRPGRPSDSA